MRKRFLFFAFLLLFTTIADALPFDDVIPFVKVDASAANSYNINQTTNYAYQVEGEAVVQVSHSISPETNVTETYYFADSSMSPISTSFNCSWALFVNTCNFHIDSGSQTTDTNHSDIRLIPSETIIMTGLGTDPNGTIGFGITIKGLITKYTYAVVFIPELSAVPLTTLNGSATYPIDIVVESMSYADYAEYQDQNQNIASVNETFWDFWFTLSSILLTLFGYLKLIFYDNPILAIAFFEVLILGYALQSKDMIQWWQRFIEAHVKLYNFLMAVIEKIIGIITAIINALKPL